MSPSIGTSSYKFILFPSKSLFGVHRIIILLFILSPSPPDTYCCTLSNSVAISQPGLRIRQEFTIINNVK